MCVLSLIRLPSLFGNLLSNQVCPVTFLLVVLFSVKAFLIKYDPMSAPDTSSDCCRLMEPFHLGFISCCGHTEPFPTETFTPCRNIVLCWSCLFCINQYAINKRRLKLYYHFKCLFKGVCVLGKHARSTRRALICQPGRSVMFLYQRISKEGVRGKRSDAGEDGFL